MFQYHNFIPFFFFLYVIWGTEECPAPYTSYSNGLCLYYSAVKVRWSDARELCTSMNGELVKIDNPDTGSVCDTLVSINNGDKYWVGVTDIVEEDNFRWLDGSRMEWSNWAYGQPNVNSLHNCVAYIVQESGWNDKPCSGQEFAYVICQYTPCQRTFVTMEHVSNLTALRNLEVTATFTANAIECAGLCHRHRLCDAIAVNPASQSCHILKLLDGVPDLDTTMTGNNGYIIGGNH